MLKKIVGFVSLFILISFLTTAGIFLFQEGTQPLPAFAAQSGPYQTAYNESGLSEAAVKILWSEPLGKFDLVYFTVDPVQLVGGASAVTQYGGVSAFPTSDTSFPVYPNGGVVFTPSSLKLNSVVAFWQAENPAIDGTNGLTGVSNEYVYEWHSVNSGSGNTGWKIKVFKWASISGASPYLQEVSAISGGSVYVGPPMGYGYTPWNSGVSFDYFTPSTTAYAVNRLGWNAGVTPYFFALGKR